MPRASECALDKIMDQVRNAPASPELEQAFNKALGKVETSKSIVSIEAQRVISGHGEWDNVNGWLIDDKLFVSTQGGRLFWENRLCCLLTDAQDTKLKIAIRTRREFMDKQDREMTLRLFLES